MNGAPAASPWRTTCDDCNRLWAECETAARKFARAGKIFAARNPSSAVREYVQFLRALEETRAGAESARLAYNNHLKTHIPRLARHSHSSNI